MAWDDGLMCEWLEFGLEGKGKDVGIQTLGPFGGTLSIESWRITAERETVGREGNPGKKGKVQGGNTYRY